MTEPAYPAARAAALRVHPRYARDFDLKHLVGKGSAELLPTLETIEAIIDVAFWASLRREENYTSLISLAFVTPVLVDMPLIFERPVPLASQPWTRLAPAVERPGIHLCVWRHHGELLVWGATRDLPRSCFVVEVVAPGLLVLKQSQGHDSSKFINVAVLEGDEIKVIDQHAAIAPDRPELIASLLDLQAESNSLESISVLTQLAVSMRAHERGGSLLVVPAATQRWQESVLKPIAYSVVPPFCAIADLLQAEAGEKLRRRWQDAFRRVIDGVAGLTAVDGATIITDKFELLAFGAKILRQPNREQVGSVIVTEPIEGTAAVIAEPGQLGGTRHLSAAQFVHDQRDGIALVASQDGRFTVFGWSLSEQMVYANRIETLLL